MNICPASVALDCLNDASIFEALEPQIDRRRPSRPLRPQLLMCAEDAPTAKVIHADNGRFSCSPIVTNDDIEFGADVTYEDLLKKK